MELNVFQRLLLLAILPDAGDITTIRIVQKLREDLSFSEEEHKVLQFETNTTTGATKWKETDLSKSVEIGTKAQELIVKQLRALDESKKLTAQHLPIWDLFIKD